MNHLCENTSLQNVSVENLQSPHEDGTLKPLTFASTLV